MAENTAIPVTTDAELDTLAQIATVLEQLDDDARTRTLDWLNARFYPVWPRPTDSVDVE